MDEEILSADEVKEVNDLANSVEGNAVVTVARAFDVYARAIKITRRLAEAIPKMQKLARDVRADLQQLRVDTETARTKFSEEQKERQRQIDAAKAERTAELEREGREHEALMQAHADELTAIKQKIAAEAKKLAALEAASV